MKKIDQLLLTSFIMPFIATFFIAMFVLVMQFLWLHIDELLGKDLEFFIILEMIFYMSISLLPLALPIAILIASVMVIGNLAEQNELASFNAAGISLMRVMRPLICIGIGASLFSLFCSSKIMPYANLKFKTRMYDIKHQKLTLNLEEKVFNDDFNNMVIRIGKKEADNQTIHDVLIYDHHKYNSKKVNVITAKKGKMFATPNRRFLIMQLFDGVQYQETKVQSKDKKESFPFVRTKFKKWDKVFDLSEFELNNTNPKVFESNYMAMGINDLRNAIDSLDRGTAQRQEQLLSDFKKSFHLFKENGKLTIVNRSPSQIKSGIPKRYSPNPFVQIPPTTSSPTSFVDFFLQKDRSFLLKKAKPLIQLTAAKIDKHETLDNSKQKKRGNLVYHLHHKFSLATVCIIFLFIGASMGAIIRKGGFGYPILIAILFFIFFYILEIFFRKLAKSQYISSDLAAWIPCLLLFPIGLLMTYLVINHLKLSDLLRFR